MFKKLLLPLDLQLFASEDGGFGAYDPSTAYEGVDVAPEPVAAEPASPEPQVLEGQPISPEGQIDVQPEPQLLDFGGRKLQANEDLTGLHKDFQEQQRYITALQEQVNAYKLAVQNQQAPQAQPQQPEAPQTPGIDTQNWTEETWQKFYDNPNEILAQALQGQVQQMVQSQLQPILQERQWNNDIQQMYQKFPDFQQYVGEIQAIVDANPQYAQQGGLENAYYRAKATASMNQPSPQQLLQDPTFVQQNILGNEQIRSQIINSYLQQRQATNNQVPTQMRGAQAYTPQTPENSPTTLREASRAFMKTLGQR